jgi:hypothetical protein
VTQLDFIGGSKLKAFVGHAGKSSNPATINLRSSIDQPSVFAEGREDSAVGNATDAFVQTDTFLIFVLHD